MSEATDYPRTIHKVLLDAVPGQDFTLPVGTNLLSIQNQGEHPVLWYDRPTNPEIPDENVHIVTIGTGHEFSEELAKNLEFIDTVQMIGGALVWHFFKYVGDDDGPA